MFNLPVKLADEFEADFENHTLGNQKIYRLHYINYYRTEDNTSKYRTVDWPFDLFTLPNGMSREDAFKVLSYLTDYIESTQNIKPCSYKSVATLNSILDLQQLGFKKLNKNVNVSEEEIIDLWTVEGRVALFKKSKYYLGYYEWYFESISLEEVQSIYKKIGKNYNDMIINSVL